MIRSYCSILFILSFLFLAASDVRAREQKIPDHLLSTARGDCHRVLSRTSRPGEIASRMPRCVMAKLGDAWTPPKKLELVEYTPWLIRNRGPAQSKGIIYYLLGWDGHSVADDFHIAPYFIARLNADGWDVVGAKFPDAFLFYRNPRLAELASIAVPFVRKKLSSLRDAGYRRVILAGHSWGGWVAMQDGLGPLDGKILLSPANVVTSTPELENGKKNPYYDRDQHLFQQGLAHLEQPTVLVLMGQDKLSPQSQSLYAREHFAKAGLPYLLLDRPPGFVGHYSSYLPVFDYAYGKCISAFLDNPGNVSCEPPVLSDKDFRTSLDFQKARSAGQPVESTGLSAEVSFLAYGLGHKSRYLHFRTGGRLSVLSTDHNSTESVRLDDGLMCVDKECSRLVRWDRDHVLEFDNKTDTLKYWWIRDQ